MGSDITDRFEKMSADELREQVAFYAQKAAQAKSPKSRYSAILKKAKAALRRKDAERFRRITRLT